MYTDYETALIYVCRHLRMDDTCEFIGKWYNIFSLRRHAKFQSERVEFEVLENGDINMYATAAKNGHCLNTNTAIGHKTDQPTVWDLQIGHQHATIKLLKASHDYAVLYECFHIFDDGTCDPQRTFVDVISKHKTHTLNEKNQEFLFEVARDACYEPGDFVKIEHSDVGCPINREVRFTCNMDDLQPVSSFDAEDFTGTWFITARLKGSSVPSSASLRIEHKEDGTYRLLTNGLRRGQCLMTKETQLALSLSGSGKMMAHFDADDSTLDVLYVDENDDFALVYECQQKRGDGSCVPGQVNGFESNQRSS